MMSYKFFRIGLLAGYIASDFRLSICTYDTMMNLHTKRMCGVHRFMYKSGVKIGYVIGKIRRGLRNN